MEALDRVLTLGSQYEDTRELIIREIGSGELTAKKHTAGIPCPDKQSTGDMLKFFSEENLAISAIKDDLQEAGLPFKAIVPTEFYEKIKLEKNVYTFNSITEEGLVSVSSNNISEFIKKTGTELYKKFENAIFMIKCLFCAAFLATGEYFIVVGILNSTEIGDVAFAIFMATFMFVIVSGIFALPLFLIAVDGLLEKYVLSRSLIARIVLKHVSKKGCEIFWPHFNDDSRGHQIGIRFLTPPDRVVESILRWKNSGHELSISAQKEAFSLDVTSIRPFVNFEINEVLGEIKREKELELQARIEARRRFWRKYDPIISTERGKFTILIDAYGEESFVSEREVTDAVSAYYGEKLQQFQTHLN